MNESKNGLGPFTKKMLADFPPEWRVHAARIDKFMKSWKKDCVKLRRHRRANLDKLRKFNEWQKKNWKKIRHLGYPDYFEMNQDYSIPTIPSRTWNEILDVCSWFRRNDKRGPNGPHPRCVARAIWAKFFGSSKSQSRKTQDFILHYISAKKTLSPFLGTINRIAEKDDLPFFVKLGRAIEQKRRKPPPDSLFNDREWMILSNWDTSVVLGLPLKYFTDHAGYCAVRYLLEKRVPAVDPIEPEKQKEKFTDLYKHWRIKLGLRKPDQTLIHRVESSEGGLILKDVRGKEIRVRRVVGLPAVGRQLLQFSSPTPAAKCSSHSQCASGRNKKVRRSSTLSPRTARCSPRGKLPKR